MQRVDAIAPEALRSLLPALRQARDELRADLSRWLATAPEGSERFTAYHRAQALRSLEATFERIEDLHPAMAGALGMGRAETGALAVGNLEHEVQRLSSIFGGGMVTLPQIDTAAVLAQGNRLLWKRHENSARRYAGSLGDDVRHRLAVSLAKGDTFDQMARRLRGSSEFAAMVARHDPGAAAFGVADATFARWRHWADRLVRTETMHAYNVQHDASIEYVNEQRHEDDEEYLRRWDATADKVSCERCKALDRTVTTIKGDFAGGVHSPPLHPYCRCVVLAWLARWGNIKGEVPALHKGGDEEIIPQEHIENERRAKASKEARAAAAEDLAAFDKHEADKREAAANLQAAKERQAKQLAQHKEKQADKSREQVAPAEAVPVEFKQKKNPKRVAAAKKAAEASAERRREIHSTVRDALSPELQVAWDKEGHKFMREQGKRIKGVKDRINASAKLSEAFAETYGSGEQTIHGNEGDRSHKRAELVAQHAEHWADEQEHKHYEAERARAMRDGLIDEHGNPTAKGKAQHKHEDLDDWGTPITKVDDDDPPF
ncbi:MAG TPA: phage minor head protein [Kofleriaceae bacterium]|nr:phage minor head protein [Kofleriaceae bacterium]